MHAGMKVASNGDHFVMLSFCIIQPESCSENNTWTCMVEVVAAEMLSGWTWAANTLEVGILEEKKPKSRALFMMGRPRSWDQSRIHKLGWTLILLGSIGRPLGSFRFKKPPSFLLADLCSLGLFNLQWSFGFPLTNNFYADLNTWSGCLNSVLLFLSRVYSRLVYHKEYDFYWFCYSTLNWHETSKRDNNKAMCRSGCVLACWLSGLGHIVNRRNHEILEGLRSTVFWNLFLSLPSTLLPSLMWPSYGHTDHEVSDRLAWHSAKLGVWVQVLSFTLGLHCLVQWSLATRGY